ncbi:Flp family type IVb pilin [Achromobacter xylosoxidans]|uniref:Flp family type IVb pilin n=1 Tax=Alcaligenes xylosoxydans xylosoxydans TaxID=85698 RepID=UPI000A6B1C42|nr:Flp family type IVb pilin [Achromobacter xylosoxidans]
MKAKLAQFWNEEEGITALEYGLIAGTIAVALVAGFGDIHGRARRPVHVAASKAGRRVHVRPKAPADPTGLVPARHARKAGSPPRLARS